MDVVHLRSDPSNVTHLDPVTCLQRIGIVFRSRPHGCCAGSCVSEIEWLSLIPCVPDDFSVVGTDGRAGAEGCNIERVNVNVDNRL